MRSIFEQGIDEIAGRKGRSPMGVFKAKAEAGAKQIAARDALKNAVINAMKKYSKPADMATAVYG
jgi:FKBP-type peptidyl-prolyl cis-trans isomerase (trigger factor)